jgi:glyoxylase-like metal-dependent hydrolase (beta-lactamase superfamily II)/rhodanese-related sulfurtransferase
VIQEHAMPGERPAILFRQLFEPETSTYTYLLGDPVSREAVLIDPVRETIERDLELLRELDLTLVHTLETHVHADHVTSSGMLRERVGSRSVVSAKGGAPCADVLAREGDKLSFGDRWLEVRETPGHTDGCLSYVLDDRSMVFTGDALLIRGTGRTDFQQGDPRRLYTSITTKLFTLPDDTRVFPGHDYRGMTSSTIAEEKLHNRRLGGGRSVDEFVAIMQALRLASPKKIAEAVPANLACGIVRPPRVDGEPSSEPTPGPQWAPIARTEQGVPEIDGTWLADHREIRVVDVREPNEWNEGHIAGAELVPLASLTDKSGGWSRDEPIAVVCRSGGRSGRAAQHLESAGFTRVASLRGGLLEWVEQGHELVRG